MKALRPPVVVPAVVGAVLLILGHATQGLVALALAGVQVIGPVVAPTTSARVGRRVGLIGHGLARAFSFVVWLPVALGFVVAWAVAPILRVKPLDRSRGWSEVGTHPDPRRRTIGAPWADHHQPPLTGGARFARFARRSIGIAAIVAVTLAVADVGPWRDEPATTTPELGAPGSAPAPIEPPFAVRDQEAGDRVREEEGALFAQMEADPTVGWRLPASFTGDELNVVDHRRASVQASQEGPVVWFFGGSTMFGSTQRDGPTIASEFARLAADDDQPVQVVNFGVHAYTAYQEAEQLEQAVDQHGPPDLVIFYDGYNDVAVTVGTSFLGAPPGVPQRAPSLAQTGEPASTTTVPPGVPPWLDPEERYAMVAAVQEQAASRASEAVGPDVPVLHFWQPSVYTREPTDEERAQLASLGLDDEAIETYAAVHEGVRAQLPDEFIDLGDALDGAPTVFADPVHTNELGARLVAEAMYERARSTLRHISR